MSDFHRDDVVRSRVNGLVGVVRYVSDSLRLAKVDWMLPRQNRRRDDVVLSEPVDVPLDLLVHARGIQVRNNESERKEGGTDG